MEPEVPGHDQGVLRPAVPHVLGVGRLVAVGGSAVCHHPHIAAAASLYLSYHGVGVDYLGEGQPQLFLLTTVTVTLFQSKQGSEALPDGDVLDVVIPVTQPVVPDVEEDQARVSPLHLDGQGERHGPVQVDTVRSLYLDTCLCQSRVKSCYDCSTETRL